jgi:hypothetical protein
MQAGFNNNAFPGQP